MANKIDELNNKIKETQDEYMARSFSYDPESDAGYKEFARLMRENGKRAMEDTVGRASGLTGGYANSYAVTAGQQAYDEYAGRAVDAQATYRQLARDEFDSQNQEILNRLALLKEERSGLWDEAALAASYGDTSKYVDLGLSPEQLDVIGGNTPPTDAQIEYAKSAYKSGGEDNLNAYVAQLQGVDSDAVFDAIMSDENLAKDPDVMKTRFTLGYSGKTNWFGGLNNDAELILDAGKPNSQTKTVKEWYEILTTPVKDGGYGWDEKNAKKWLKDLQEKLGVK